jgi:hypothetical protein
MKSHNRQRSMKLGLARDLARKSCLNARCNSDPITIAYSLGKGFQCWGLTLQADVCSVGDHDDRNNLAQYQPDERVAYSRWQGRDLIDYSCGVIHEMLRRRPLTGTWGNNCEMPGSWAVHDSRQRNRRVRGNSVHLWQLGSQLGACGAAG